MGEAGHRDSPPWAWVFAPLAVASCSESVSPKWKGKPEEETLRG